jgi:nicotinate-nucleotide pyrophosphorylase (carboxylating)
MKPAFITDKFLNHFIEEALQEDIGNGDHSSLASIPKATMGRAKLLVKEDGIIAGVELAEWLFEKFDPTIKFHKIITDGEAVSSGDIAFTIEGPARSMLSMERLVLNCMQRMSAIATKTKHLMGLISGTNARILDTRKTTPNFRRLEKWAVAIGGGSNHRMGLFDMIMLKDNHIDIAGGIKAAINRTNDYLRDTKMQLPIEIESRSIEEVKEVLAVGGVDIIMLDNMAPQKMKEAVILIDGRFKTEASGGITEKTIRQIAACGVDYISVGELTHSVKSLDLSLKVY